MAASPLELQTADVMNCPTCRAEQPWSDQCRRCKCDLSTLHDVWNMCRQARASCLRDLRAGRVRRAIDEARRYAALRPDDDSLRLLSVCHLLAGDFDQASRGYARLVK